MNSIKLIEGKAEFEVFISAWTAGKMDKAQQLLAGKKAKGDKEAIPGYNAPEHKVNDLLNTFELSPDYAKENEGFKIFLPLLLKLEAGEIERTEVAKKLIEILSATMTMEDHIQNGRILRELVKLMCLESELTSSQIKLIKSEIDSDFWQSQDAVLLRDTGENFRLHVMGFSKRN